MILRVLLTIGAGCVALALAGCPLFPAGISLLASSIRLELLADGLPTLVGVEFPDDGSGRAFLVGQAGQILIRDSDGAVAATAWLDIRDRLVTLDENYDERGLLGLALHPEFSDNGRLFVVYSAPPSGPDIDSVLRLSEFSALPALDFVTPASERILLTIDKPGDNHNGGQLRFGPDGFLYLSVGDGGGQGDSGAGHTPEIGNSQDRRSLLGKILRIDVDAAQPYAIPADNPFADSADARPEIYALGLRNPWRFSFDGDGDDTRLFVADVGQNLFEEINLVVSGGNYGWRVREATTCVNLAALSSPLDDCAATDAFGAPLLNPILSYDRSVGRSVTGGYVYRGRAIAALRGKYIFGDLSAALLSADGRFFAASESSSGVWSYSELAVEGRADGRIGEYIYSFAQDRAGELYVITNPTISPTASEAKLYQIVGAE